MKIIIFLLCNLALGLCNLSYQRNDEVNEKVFNVSTNTEFKVVNTTEQTLDEERENDRKLMEQWTRMFFSMGRVPQQGAQVLIFPGLFNGSTTVEVSRPRELRSLTGAISNSSTILPAYIVDDQVVTEVTINSSTMTNFTTQNFIQLSNDSRLFVDGEQYHFKEVESLDEDQRQRRRLRSARNEINLLNADHEHISIMINSVFSTARNYINNQTVRASVVRYLTSKMRSLGLVTGNQIFHPQEFSPLFGEGNTPNGTNVIGILPGELWGTKDDEVLVIGAHWDTVPFSGGMDDNGSGVTAVIEVARAMTEGGCRPKHSVIFVAFDLEEVGCLGSIFFVRDFLIQQVLKPHGAKLKGAFILDTLMNYNETRMSQTLSPEWQKALPEFWDDLKAENQTGDFLAVMYRKDVDAHLADTFASHWKGDGKQPQKKNTPRDLLHGNVRKYRVDNTEFTIMKTDTPIETIKSSSSKYRMKKIRMNLVAEVGEKLEELTDWIDLLRSDHSRFWYHNIEGFPRSFPAVLITDTAPYRGVMQECYHQECDSSSSNQRLKFADIQFLTKTCQALIDSMVSLSDSKCLFQPQQPETTRNPRPDTNKQIVFSSSKSCLVKSSYLPILLTISFIVIQWINMS